MKEKGTVKWFNGAKGMASFTQTGEDVFVHYSVIQENGYRTLNEGETVEFECVKGPKGLQAQNVSRGLIINVLIFKKALLPQGPFSLLSNFFIHIDQFASSDTRSP